MKAKPVGPSMTMIIAGMVLLAVPCCCILVAILELLG